MLINGQEVPREVMDSLSLADRWLLTGDWWEAFDSSNVWRIRYDYAEKNLYVDFLTSDGGHYAFVPEEVARDFYLSPSKGRFIHSRLKNNYRYPWYR